MQCRGIQYKRVARQVKLIAAALVVGGLSEVAQLQDHSQGSAAGGSSTPGAGWKMTSTSQTLSYFNAAA